jgi:hypothetical protein
MCGYYNKRRMFLKGFIFVIVFLTVMSLVLMLLWNWLMPAIFGLTTINYFQALGILILSKIIFTGVGKRPSPYYYKKRHDYWHKKFEEAHTNENEEDSKDEEVC